MGDKVNTEGDKSAPPGAITAIDRSTLLSLLSEVLKSQHTKVINGRIRDEKAFKLRLESVRVFAYVASVYGGLLKDKDLSDILKRLEALESNANEQH